MRLFYRRLILLFFVFTFFISGSFLIFFGSGYQWDWGKRKIIKRGSILIESKPKEVLIYLNKNLYGEKTTPILINLLPNEYLVEIKKEGYHPWEKTLNVESKKVTFAQNILLFPKNPSFEILKETEKIFTESTKIDLSYLNLKEDFEKKLKTETKGFLLSPDEKNLLWWNDFELWIFSLEKEKEEILARYSKKIEDALWHPSSAHVIFTFSDSIRVIEIDNRSGKNVVELIKTEKIDDLLMIKRGVLYFKVRIKGEEKTLKMKIQ